MQNDDIARVRDAIRELALNCEEIRKATGLSTDRVLDALDALDNLGSLVVIEGRNLRGKVCRHSYRLKQPAGSQKCGDDW